MLFVSASSGRATYRLISDGRSTQGVVTKVKGAHLTVQFKSSNGETLHSAQSGLIWGFRVGEHVGVLYSASDPKGTACIAAPGALWFPTGVMALLGGSFFFGGVSRRALSLFLNDPQRW